MESCRPHLFEGGWEAWILAKGIPDVEFCGVWWQLKFRCFEVIFGVVWWGYWYKADKPSQNLFLMAQPTYKKKKATTNSSDKGIVSMVRFLFLRMLEMIDWGQPFAFKASETCLKPNFIGRYLHAFLHLFCQIRVFFVFISLKISNCFTIALFKRSSNCLMLLKCYD